MRNDLSRIDFHHHAIPAVLRSALEERSLTAGGWANPEWTPEQSIAEMDAQGTATGLLSISSPGVHFGDDADATALAQRTNDALAEAVKDRPDRFGFFACLPLPDVDAALAEAARALDELGADGIGLLANSRGQYIFDPAVRPLLEELDRRGTTIFVHPNELPGGHLDSLPAPVADFTLDTTRAAFGLVLSGAMQSLTGLRIVLSHAGGSVPLLAHRFAQTVSTGVDPSRSADELLAGLRRFYLDTALASSPTSLPSILAFVEPDHLVFGSDNPFANSQMSRWFADQLDEYGLDKDRTQAIASGNAGPLIPRLTTAAV